ncbi:hypothetical protein SAMN03159463_05305 [Mesorhizobium sp. NFR06]|uniref:hypothetical protein n=1 Tax=Mesorhizobium sp. NFR06 TaxID=1566290 RepID=UPI0008F4230E|nr:hypothetical protein [Mesorhizobium sp. NFR06]SFP98124.1 hypothetical protein SAMN03159463_05305 [Mesorhizobium sp. NFR06]
MSPAERMRRTRERRHKGLMPVMIDIHDVEVPAFLVVAGYLKDANDREAIPAALQRWIADETRPAAYENVAAQRRALFASGTLPKST